MFDTASLIYGLIFGSIGFGYFRYGKKQQRPVVLFCGIALMGYPYLVSDPSLLPVIGVVLMVLPKFIKG